MIALLYVIIILAIVATPAYITNAVVQSRVKGGRRALRQVTIAERALRSIANNAGNSSLEAQIALDEIANLYDRKELN